MSSKSYLKIFVALLCHDVAFNIEAPDLCNRFLKTIRRPCPQELGLCSPNLSNTLLFGGWSAWGVRCWFCVCFMLITKRFASIGPSDFWQSLFLWYLVRSWHVVLPDIQWFVHLLHLEQDDCLTRLLCWGPSVCSQVLNSLGPSSPEFALFSSIFGQFGP